MEIGVGWTAASMDLRRRVRYGSEGEDWGAAEYPCRDCNVVSGQLHHWFCDVARCPDCGGQEHEGPC
jgi:hypothetical protein